MDLTERRITQRDPVLTPTEHSLLLPFFGLESIPLLKQKEIRVFLFFGEQAGAQKVANPFLKRNPHHLCFPSAVGTHIQMFLLPFPRGIFNICPDWITSLRKDDWADAIVKDMQNVKATDFDQRFELQIQKTTRYAKCQSNRF